MTPQEQQQIARFTEAVRRDYREMYGKEMPVLNQELTVWQILRLILPWNS